jgi:uncharacterized membrane protein
MNTYLLVKTLHVISATIVFGTGIGIATFMFLGHLSPDPAARAFARRQPCAVRVRRGMRTVFGRRQLDHAL